MWAASIVLLVSAAAAREESRPAGARPAPRSAPYRPSTADLQRLTRPSRLQRLQLCAAVTNMTCGHGDAPLRFFELSVTNKQKMKRIGPNPKLRQQDDEEDAEISEGIPVRITLVIPNCSGDQENMYDLINEQRFGAIISIYRSPLLVGINGKFGDANMILKSDVNKFEVRIRYYTFKGIYNISIDYLESPNAKYYSACSYNLHVIRNENNKKQIYWPDNFHLRFEWFRIDWNDTLITFQPTDTTRQKIDLLQPDALICRLERANLVGFRPRLLSLGQLCGWDHPTTYLTVAQPPPANMSDFPPLNYHDISYT